MRPAGVAIFGGGKISRVLKKRNKPVINHATAKRYPWCKPPSKPTKNVTSPTAPKPTAPLSPHRADAGKSEIHPLRIVAPIGAEARASSAPARKPRRGCISATSAGMGEIMLEVVRLKTLNMCEAINVKIGNGDKG